MSEFVTRKLGAMKLIERAPERVVAGVLVQTVGHHPQHPDYMFN